jgi:acyl-CoA reductase-like NAD-dependent aldehyde dehydrogenase
MENTSPIYCGGDFVSTKNKLEVKNSWDSGLLGSCFLAGPEELEQAIIKAIAVEDTLKDLPSYERYISLQKVASGLSLNKEKIATLLSKEACKPLKYALAEVDRGIQVFTVAAEESKRLPKEYISLDWTPLGKGKEGFVRYFPLGLVAGISPFNFPLLLTAHKIAPALAAGCPIILKPSSSTPLTTLALAKIIDGAAFPKGSVSILPMDRSCGNLLVTDERFKLLTFTGSPDVGWKMKKDAGKKKVVLELGGNAGVIVTAGCDIEKAVGKCLAGAFAYAGQVCIHTQRIYVENSIFDDFASRFVSQVKHLKQGPPDDIDTDITAMIDEPNAIRVEKWVKDSLASGAKLLCGGQRHNAFFEPTVLTDTDFSMNVCCKEVFGPVVTLERFSSFEQAIDWVNNSEFGLQAGVFTNEISQMDYAFDKLEVGGVIINDIPGFRIDHMPYGGVKNSGLGREGIKYAIMDMMEPRLLVK